MLKVLYTIVDTLILLICLPFYAIAVPALLLWEWVLQRRSVRLGMETTHWPGFDLREDSIVVDVSRVDEGLVGIRRRRWGVYGGGPMPPYPDTVEYISLRSFWVPSPLLSRVRTRQSNYAD
ncbi:MAG: hypothetical protein H7210_09460 [Pyrinomonadaceae bacterium]|nr:hypothetical protein [Phycisphaerales bacterium]